MVLILQIKRLHVATNIELEEPVGEICQENRNVMPGAIKTTTANITSTAQPIGAVGIHGVMKREQQFMLGALTKSAAQVYITAS